MAIDASATSDADTRNAAGIAPLAMVLALWLGALAALLAVPSMDRGRRRWTGPLGAVGLAAVAGLGVAASGYPSGVDALPGPLALIRPLLPTSWAVDATRACIESARSSVALDAAVLVGWLIVGAMVVLAVTVGAGRRSGARRPAAA